MSFDFVVMFLASPAGRRCDIAWSRKLTIEISYAMAKAYTNREWLLTMVVTWNHLSFCTLYFFICFLSCADGVAGGEFSCLWRRLCVGSKYTSLMLSGPRVTQTSACRNVGNCQHRIWPGESAQPSTTVFNRVRLRNRASPQPCARGGWGSTYSNGY